MLRLHPAQADRLGNIVNLVKVAPRLQPRLKGLDYMCKLPGALLFTSDLDLDTDGKTLPGVAYDKYHQGKVSYGGSSVDSNELPYFVLPAGFASQHGIEPYDIAAVLYEDRIEYAQYVDNGPQDKIGEGSVALHRSLGFERLVDRRIIDCGIDRGVVTVVLAGSGQRKLKTAAQTRLLGRKRFEALGGRP